MPALKERLIHWGEQFDAAMERYIFHWDASGDAGCRVHLLNAYCAADRMALGADLRQSAANSVPKRLNAFLILRLYC